MPDEPRRSGRETKGQHTKIDTSSQPVEPKKRGGRRGKKKAAEQEAEDVIRCVCGVTREEDPEPWIACDSCGVWQHNICVGIPIHEEDIPKKYSCEMCAPEQHKELLAGLDRGAKIWEKRRRAHEQQQAEEGEAEAEGNKRKGGRGKKKGSEVGAVNGKSTSPSLQASETPKDTKENITGGSVKRKARDGSHDVKETPAKTRKASAGQEATGQKSPPHDLTPIENLDKSRKGPALLLHKAMLHAIPVAVAAGVYTYGPNETLESKSEQLASQLENAVLETHPDADAYKKQCRTLSANLKQNQELCNSLLTKKRSVNALAIMTSDDMMTKDLQVRTAEMKALADKQAVMITDDAPRMRRTHKGDEMVEGDHAPVQSSSMTSASLRRSMLDPNGDMATRSRENSPGADVLPVENIEDHLSHDEIRGNAVPKQPLQIDTKAAPTRKASMKSDFDFQQVLSSVQSPTAPPSNQPRRVSSFAPPAGGPGEDADIDRLLEDDNSSPPYSPQEYDSDPDIVWRGIVNMDSIARFPASAKHIGGADLMRTMTPPVPYSELLAKELKIAGRIAVEQANEYLCGLRYAPAVDIVIVSITATGERAAEGFKEIYDYFHSKGRYGVLANKGTGNIRDTYLVPIPASPAPLPDYVTNLTNHKIPLERAEPMLLITLVVRTQWMPETDRSFEGQGSANSPMAGPKQRQMSNSIHGPSMSPSGLPDGHPSASATPSYPYSAQSPEEAQRRAQEERRILDQREGEQKAARILGHHVAAPTVAFLLPQAYQMRELEWEAIRVILESDERARVDLQHLSQVLEENMKSQSRQS